VLKVSVKGEVFPFDETRYPMAEAIQIEDGLGVSFGRYQEMLRLGHAKAVCAFTWAVLHRNGRDVPLADILSGSFELSTGDVDIEAEGEAEPGPTDPSSPSTSGDGSPSSPTASGTRPTRSGRSRSTSSTT
jgi:hypothetical protein